MDASRIRHTFGPIHQPRASVITLDPPPRRPDAMILEAEAIMLGEVGRLLRRMQRRARGCGCDRCARDALATVAWAERIGR